MNWYNRHIKIAMPKKREWTEDELQVIKELIEEGYSYDKISQLFGVNRNSIRYLSLKYKWREPRKSFSPEKIEEIKQLVLSKKPLYEIASMFGVSDGVIESLNKKYKWRDYEKEKAEMDRFIVDLYLLPPEGKGMSSKQIRDQYGIFHRRVWTALDRMGLSDKKRGMSEEVKRIYEENPEKRKQQGESLRRRYEEDPELRERMSELNKQHYVDNPALKDQISQRMKEYWKNYPGGYYAWLSTFPPEKQKEIERARSINSIVGRLA